MLSKKMQSEIVDCIAYVIHPPKRFYSDYILTGILPPTMMSIILL